jgi:putative tryptophan/tyrosine transport system substrate-binding protein
MRRREFLAGTAYIAATRRASAQQSRSPKRLAIFSPFEAAEVMREDGAGIGYRIFFAELRRFGWIEGATLAVERYGKERNVGDLRALADAAMRGMPDVIYAIGPGVFDIKDHAGTTPLVTFTYDPIALGLTENLAHPGGSITGISVDTGPTIWGKRIELLREMLPSLSKLAFLSLRTPAWDRFLRPAVAAACDAARLSLIPVLIDLPPLPEAYRHGIEAAARDGADAIMIAENPETLSNAPAILEAVTAARLVAMYALRAFVDAGGLIAYAPDPDELSRRSAADIDAILRGVKPGDIPYLQGTKFNLFINVKTAKALGLTVPQLLLAQADEVIE